MLTRVIIAGSRKFNNQELFTQTIDDILENLLNTDIEIVSGGCRGADKMAEEYANSHSIPLTVFQANWFKYGKGAGPIRNTEMAEYASSADKSVLIAFPIGKSVGTRNMIKLAHVYNLDEIHVIKEE